MSLERSEAAENLVLASRHGHVLTLTLNRPERLNASTPPMRQRFFTLLNDADENPDVRCIVVTGIGKGFWPGEDRMELAKIDDNVIAEQSRNEKMSYDLPMKMTTPIVAAINGAVAGVGFSFALLADIRVAARGVKWSAAFAGLGLVAEAGMSWSLPRHVGWGNALKILLTAEPFTSEEAYRMGLVQHLESYEDVLSVAQHVARLIARNSPFSVKNIREQVRLDWARSWEEAYADAGRRAQVSLGRDDFHRAVAAVIHRREAIF